MDGSPSKSEVRWGTSGCVCQVYRLAQVETPPLGIAALGQGWEVELERKSSDYVRGLVLPLFFLTLITLLALFSPARKRPRLAEGQRQWGAGGLQRRVESGAGSG